MRKLGIGATARAITLLAIGAAIVATGVRLRDSSVSSADHSDTAVSNGALTHELRRCQAIGIAAKDDAACQAAWAENRRRFFAPLTDRALAPASHSDVKAPR